VGSVQSPPSLFRAPRGVQGWCVPTPRGRACSRAGDGRGSARQPGSGRPGSRQLQAPQQPWVRGPTRDLPGGRGRHPATRASPKPRDAGDNHLQHLGFLQLALKGLQTVRSWPEGLARQGAEARLRYAQLHAR